MSTRQFILLLIIILLGFFYPGVAIPEYHLNGTKFSANANSDSFQKEKRRTELLKMMGIPFDRCDLDPEFRGSFEHKGLVIERWIYTSEPGSKVTSLLYRPKESRGLMPGMVITNGHGNSKSTANNIYTAQLYAKMGIATLVYDTIGEEERHIKGKKGTRAHDAFSADERAAKAGRLMMGKMVFDVMRGVDFLLERDDIDPEMIGVAGNSMGGTKATWMLALEPRLKAVVVSGWGFGSYNSEMGKRCSRVPALLREDILSWPEYLLLAEKNASVLVMNGGIDEIIDQNGSGKIWKQTKENVAKTASRFANYGNVIETWFDPEGGHRSYHNHKDAFLWLYEHFNTPGWSKQNIEQLPEITFDQWLERNNLHFENSHYKLYWPDRHMRGGRYLDLNIKLIPEEKLKCLNPDEIGLPEYTLEGWLDLIERKQ
ncbi:MAG: acetylxylan esterase [candidate division KSB1 bacterium]|nr:acetylxylan esterase [candidate division KSB1 bacterium]